MNQTPQLCVIVPLPSSAPWVSDLLWSLLRQRALAFEAIVLVDRGRAPAAAAIAGSTARTDSRVRVMDAHATLGAGAAIAAALAETHAEFVTVAEPDGLCVDGAYQAIMASLESSGSDMAIGFAENGSRGRIVRATDGALDVDARGVRLSDLPGLIADDLLCTKVVRREVLQRAIGPGQPWTERAVAARVTVSARRIDVLPRAAFWRRRSEISDTSAPASPEWIEDLRLARGAVAGATRSVRECQALVMLVRDVLETRTLDALGESPVTRGLSDLVCELAEDLSRTSLALLAPAKRWQLAVIAADRSEQIDVVRQLARPAPAGEIPLFDDRRLASEAWETLGLGGRDVRSVFIDRFVTGTEPAPVMEQPEPGAIDVSVIIPTYNVVSFIDELLDSIRSAVGVRLEIIVVDDGSDDGTWQRLMAHSEADARVRAVRSLGRGGGQARNVGIELARGEYLAFADGDDLIPPRAYERMLELARRSSADVVSGNYLKFFATHTWDAGPGFNGAYSLPVERVGIEQHPQLARHRAVWNRLVRREHWLQNALPFPGVPRSNDIVAMMSVLLSAESHAVTSVPVYVYRDRPGTGSMTAAGGSVDYTVSYFYEEAVCAVLVAQRGSDSVAREYWTMVLMVDAWGNILKYVGQRSKDRLADERVARQIALLLSRAPRDLFHAIPADRQMVWALAASGRFDEAQTVVDLMRAPSDVSLAAVTAAFAGAADLPEVSRPVVSSFARRFFLRRFIDDRSRQSDVLTEAIPVMRRLLTDEVSPMPFVPLTSEARLAQAVMEAEAGEVRKIMSLPSPRVPAELRAGLRGVRIVGGDDLEGVELARLVARQYGDRRRERHPVGQIVVEDARWWVDIDPRVVPRPGVWVLELEHEDRWGLRRFPLKLVDRSARAIPSRLQRVLLIGGRKGPSMVRVRDSLQARFRRIAKRALQL